MQTSYNFKKICQFCWDRPRKGFFNIVSRKLLNSNNFKHYSRNTYLGVDFADKFKRTISDHIKRPVFEQGDANWIEVLPIMTEQYSNRVHTSTKLTPIQGSLKKNEGYIHLNLLDKRKKIKPKFLVNGLVRAPVIKRFFSKRKKIFWSHKLYKTTENVSDTNRVIAWTIYQSVIRNDRINNEREQISYEKIKPKLG